MVPYEGGAVEVDVVLVAVGRAPVTAGVGLEGTRVEVERGFVKVDPATQQTAEPGVYAVGDIVAGTPQLAHAGFAEGIAAITHIATGRPAPVDYRAVPAIVYTRPEVAAVGLTEEKAQSRRVPGGRPYPRLPGCGAGDDPGREPRAWSRSSPRWTAPSWGPRSPAPPPGS